MPAPTITTSQLETLLKRMNALEARVQELEQGRTSPPRRAARSDASGAAATLDASRWTIPYVTADLEVSETWIELHEPSARPQLQRLLREVVQTEGPITERLALDRIRRAWGLKRAGGRVQEAFDQAVRQLVARALIERVGDALRIPGTELEQVRVPSDDDELSRRGAEDVPLIELSAAIGRAAATLAGPVDEDDLTMRIAKVFGWTRRGGAIQERLNAALDHADEQGLVKRSGGSITASR
ncbi:MAG: DUF3320 domain-containing protein [Gaiellales bacterium]